MRSIAQTHAVASAAMHVPNRPTPGATRQLPDSRTTEATGDAVGAATTGEAVGAGAVGVVGVVGAVPVAAVGAGVGTGVGANTATAPDTVGATKPVTPRAVAASANPLGTLKSPSVDTSVKRFVI